MDKYSADSIRLPVSTPQAQPPVENRGVDDSHAATVMQHIAAPLDPRDPAALLIFAADVRGAFGIDLRLRRAVERDELHRLNRGQYYPTADWRGLKAAERYAVKVHAAALSRRAPPPLSHYSSAVLWGLPIIGSWPDEVHFLSERKSGGRSYPGTRLHALGLDARDVVVHRGVLVTTVPRTVVDLAAVLELKSAVALIDSALAIDRFARRPPLTTKQELMETWERMLPFRGSVRARALIEFGTHLSGSTGESGSRVNIALNGFPEPVLQRQFVIDGCQYDTDFYWPDEDAVGECDGDSKYSDPALLQGRSPDQIVKAEKEREDRIRRRVSGFTRWDSSVALSRLRLRTRLLELGLPPGRSRLAITPR